MAAPSIRFWHDGQLRTLENANLPLAGHLGTAYGLGLYETGRWLGHKVALQHYHETRLAHGLHILGARTEAEAANTAKEVFMTLASVLAGTRTPLARFRLDAWWQGSSGPYGLGAAWQLEVALRWQPLPADPFCNQPPVVLGLADGFHPHTGRLAGLKTTSAATYTAAAHMALAQGWHDAILLNPTSQVAETTRYNLWAYLRGRWITPAAEGGLVNGTLRQWLLDQGVGREGTLSVSTLQEAQALCLTNAVNGLVPVQTLVLEGEETSLEVGPATRSLREAILAGVESS